LIRLAVIFAPLLLTGCAMAPFYVQGSDAAQEAAKAEGSDMLPRLKPRAIGICYSPAFNEPAEVEAEAIYLCDGGRVVQKDEDVFWNGCSLSQPHRINYVCYPPDKAKTLRGGEVPSN
jgi:hypothetical protein